MADFIKRRPKLEEQSPKPKKEREIGSVSAPKKTSISKEEHPITALRRVAKDFGAGIAALQRLSMQPQPGTNKETVIHRVLPGQTTEKHTEKVVSRNLSSQTREVHRDTQLKQGMVPASTPGPVSRVLTNDRFHYQTVQIDGEKAAKTQVEKQTAERVVTKPEYVPTRALTRRGSAPRPIATSARRQMGGLKARSQATSSREARTPVTGADREARRHFDGSISEDSLHSMPSAARLAQIVRADSLMRSGEVQKNPTVQSWAQAIRAGKRREIADIDPERVQKVLYESVGGAASAERLLHTPEVQRLVERHHSTLTNIQNNLKTTASNLERITSSRTKGVAHAPSRAAAATRYHPLPNRDYTGPGGSGLSVPAAEEVGQSNVSDALAGMLATNEEPHLFAEESEQRQVMQTNAREQAGGGSGAKSDAVQPRQSAPRRDMPSALLGSPEPRRELPSAISAPPQRAGPSESKEQEKRRGKENMILSGTMTLVSKGQTLGEMKVNGELR